MAGIILESIKVIITGLILAYLWWIGREKQLYGQPSWRYTIAGFGLIFLGGVVEIIGNRIYEPFWAQTVGYLLGFALILAGLWRLFPLLAATGQIEQELERSTEQLDSLVETHAAELRQANELLRWEIEEHQQAELALRESEAKNRALLDAIPDMMFVISKDGTYLDFNPAQGQEPLLPPSEFLGKTVFEVMPPELARQTIQYVERTLQSGASQLFEYQLAEQDGAIGHYEARLVVSSVQADEVLAIVRNITQRKAREALIEAERARIARDLHDGLAQSLYLLGLKLDYRRQQAGPPAGSVTGEIAPLTGPELDVLRLVAQGLSNCDIGLQLGLAEKTVSNRLTLIFNKLQVDNRVQATLFALREGLVSLDGGGG